ncbi:MFS general substrate transporter [Polychaeton citri CBS 116435]|uniref:MFS general substrate transporter n=1 Tax=Polychaeton citri CBS 116435 TaxID=1314669 RepID=A0A9P4QI92_9PEZI|nr:MFS general substrate transporter [Polychaeton citri CBS 116435]
MEVDGGYGWVCVVCMLLLTAHTWGINGAFGVFLANYISDNVFPGTNEITYSIIGALSISQITFIAPLVTLSGKVLRTRPTLLIGVVLECGGLIGASFARKVWHLVLSQGLAFGWGCSFLYVGSVGIVPQWFTKRQSLATTTAAAGSGLGGMIYIMSSEAAIRSIGLDWSFRIVAITAFTVNISYTILMRDRNTDISANLDGFAIRLLQRPELLLMLAWVMFGTLGYTIILFSLPDNADKIGLSAQQGAIVLAIANLGMALGRLTVRYFSDLLGHLNMASITTILGAVWCLCLWTSANSYATLIAFAFFGGTVIGTYYATVGSIIAHTMGIDLLAPAFSFLWTFTAVSTFVAEPVALALRRSHLPAYLDAQAFAGCTFLAATIAIVALRGWNLLTSDNERQLSGNKCRGTTDDRGPFQQPGPV